MVAATSQTLPSATPDSVWVFERTAPGIWSAGIQLSPPAPPLINDAYGSAVAIHGDTAAVGARRFNTDQGAVWLFRRDTSGNWLAADAPLQPPAGTLPLSEFGQSVALEDDVLAVGAPFGIGNSQPGQVHLFERQGDGTWQASAGSPLTSATTPARQGFGYSLAMHGSNLLIGNTGLYNLNDPAETLPLWAREQTELFQLARDAGLFSDGFE